MRLKLASFACCVLLAACAAPPPPDTAKLTYESKPAGAKLYQGQTLLGTAPLMQSYPTGGKPSINTPPVTAVWASGAKTSFWTQLKPGDDQVATLERPANAPNLDADLAAEKTIQADADRIKDQTLRDQRRNSAACQDAMAKGNTTVAANVCN